MLNDQTITLNLVPDEVSPMAYVTQDDVGRTIKLVLVDGNQAFYLSPSYTYSLRGTKPSGTGFLYDDAITVVGGNVVSFKTNSVMTAVAGPVRCGLIIYDGDEHVETLNFILYVQKTALDAETIIDSNDFDSIIENVVQEYITEHGIGIEQSLTDEAKAALIALLEKVAYIVDDGQDYLDDLEEELYNTTWQVTNTLSHCTSSNAASSVAKGGSYSATITASAGYTLTGATISITMGGNDITSTAYSNGSISIAAVTGSLVITVGAAQIGVSSISAVYTQSGTVLTSDSLDSLKSDLVVTATMIDSSTAVIPSADYTLSGTLAAGTSTVTVTYHAKTTTFTVTVTTSYAISSSPLTMASTGTGASWDSTTSTGTITRNGSASWINVVLQGLLYKYSEVSDKTLRITCTIATSGFADGASGRGALIAIGLFTSANPTNSSSQRKADYTFENRDINENGTFNVVLEGDVADMFTATGLDDYYLGFSFFLNKQGSPATATISNIVAEVY